MDIVTEMLPVNSDVLLQQYSLAYSVCHNYSTIIIREEISACPADLNVYWNKQQNKNIW